MIRRLVSIVTAGLLLVAVLAPAAPAKGPKGPKGPKPAPDPVLTMELVCDWEPVPEGGWPPIPVPHLDAIVTWSDIGRRAELSVLAGDYSDGERRNWAGHWSLLRHEQSGGRDLHLDAGIQTGDQMWATATISNRKGVLVSADVEIGC
ncbi:MAG: hypothetical protein ACR2OI_08185 [Acidimicrobiia bacterium]